MSALSLLEPGMLRAADVAEISSPGTGEVQARVHRVGACGTDLHAFKGRQSFFTYPRILKHELGVEVLAVGPGVTRVAPGDRCAVEPYLHCGSTTFSPPTDFHMGAAPFMISPPRPFR